MKTTLNKIRAHGPCGLDPRESPLTGFCKLRAHLGEDFDPDNDIDIVTVLDSNGLDDALWCLRAVDGHDWEIRMLSISLAREVQHLMTDPRSRRALDVAESYAYGRATEDERRLARAEAENAFYAAVGDTAYAAGRAAASVVYAAAWDAAENAAYAAGRAAVGGAAVGGAAVGGDDAAAVAKQEQLLREACAQPES